MGYCKITPNSRQRLEQDFKCQPRHHQEQGKWLRPNSRMPCCNAFNSLSKGIIDINQDKLGKAATTFRPSGSPNPVSGQIYPYWAGPLSDGVVIGLAAASGAATLSVNFQDVPGLGSGTYSWKEMYSGRTGSGTSVSFSLGSHDMAVIKVTTSSGTNPSTTVSTTTGTKTSAPPVSTSTGGCSSSQWGQCGGNGWSGCRLCVSGTTCQFVNGKFEP
jgi:hypothetical protein